MGKKIKAVSILCAAILAKSARAGRKKREEAVEKNEVTGIIGALEEEVDSLKKGIKNAKITSIAGMEFCEGTLDGKKVVVVKCGIGKVNAGACAQILINVFGVNRIINTGVAGSLDASIDIGDNRLVVAFIDYTGKWNGLASLGIFDGSFYELLCGNRHIHTQHEQQNQIYPLNHLCQCFLFPNVIWVQRYIFLGKFLQFVFLY